MGTRVVSPAEGCCKKVMRSGVLAKTTLHHSGDVSINRVRLLLCDLESLSCNLYNLGNNVLRKLKTDLEKGLGNLDSILESESTTGMISST